MAFSDDDFNDDSKDEMSEKMASIITAIGTFVASWLFAFCLGVLAWWRLSDISSLWYVVGGATVFALICSTVVLLRKGNYDRGGPKNGTVLATIFRAFFGGYR